MKNYVVHYESKRGKSQPIKNRNFQHLPLNCFYYVLQAQQVAKTWTQIINCNNMGAYKSAKQKKGFFKLSLLVLLALSGVCSGQNSPIKGEEQFKLKGLEKGNLSTSVPTNGFDIKSTYRQKTAHLVVDGILIQSKNKNIVLPDSLRIVRQWISRDQEKLTKVGFKYSDSGIDLFESPGVSFHHYVYSHYRDRLLPIALWDHMVPFIVNNELVTPVNYDKLPRHCSDCISSISFERWDSPLLSQYENLAFGAFIITTK